MLDAIVARLGADRSRSWMLGDSVSDVQAARAAGLRAGLVFATNRCELCPLRAGPVGLAPDAHGATLAELAGAILRRG
jgi:D-glycero-D-manno-heptose 1,7-bisphosphate phosphatase